MQTTLFNFQNFDKKLEKIEKKEKLSFLSYSKISTFLQCPLKYKFSYILKIPRPAKPYFSFGQSMHDTLDIFMKRFKQDLENTTLSDLIDIYAKNWIKEGYADEKEEKDYWDLGRGILSAFLEKIKKQKPKVIFTEKRFILNFDDFKLAGIIDRVDESKDDYIIWDYKTGKEEKLEYMRKDLQLPIYSLAAEHILGKRANKVGRIYLRTLREVVLTLSDKEIAESKEKIVQIANKIINTKEFEPKKSILCNYCDFKEICPAMK